MDCEFSRGHRGMWDSIFLALCCVCTPRGSPGVWEDGSGCNMSIPLRPILFFVACSTLCNPLTPQLFPFIRRAVVVRKVLHLSSDRSPAVLCLCSRVVMNRMNADTLGARGGGVSVNTLPALHSLVRRRRDRGICVKMKESVREEFKAAHRHTSTHLVLSAGTVGLFVSEIHL